MVQNTLFQSNTIEKLRNNFDKMDYNISEIKYIDLFCGLGAFHNAFNKYKTITRT